MDKQSLLIFIHQILQRDQKEKAQVTLEQLKVILQRQGNVSGAELVEQVLKSIPEAKQIAQSDLLTERDLEIAWSRAQRRIRQEEMARRHGRC